MLQGSLPALVTPFTDGALDLATLKKLVEWHIAEGSNGLVPVGTTGESPTLTHAEHETVVAEVVKAAAGRIPVVAGAGSNNTTESIRLAKHAESVGADAVLVVTPYYNKPTQAGLIAHFTAIHEACGLPIIIYNIPGRSVVDMLPETMAELAKLPRIIGVKDATGDLARVCDQRMLCGPDFVQLSGEDATAHGFNAQGGVGCISVTANVAPKLLSQMQAFCLAGDYASALEIQDKLMPLHNAIFTEPGLVGVKYAMARLGLCSDEVRLPLVADRLDDLEQVRAPVPDQLTARPIGLLVVRAGGVIRLVVILGHHVAEEVHPEADEERILARDESVDVGAFRSHREVRWVLLPELHDARELAIVLGDGQPVLATRFRGLCPLDVADHGRLSAGAPWIPADE